MSIEEIFEEVKERKANNMKYLDWEMAERLCETNQHCTIYAGLLEDPGNTQGKIYENGKWYKGYVYDQSFWATPGLVIYYENSEHEVEVPCFTTEKHDSTGVPEWWGRGETVYDD